MSHVIEGKILVALPTTNGQTKTGKDWEKKEFVLETSERFPIRIRFSMVSFDGPVEDAPSVDDNDVKAYQIEKLG